MGFEQDLSTAIRALRQRGRVSLRSLMLELGCDESYVEAIADELVDVLAVARREDGAVLGLIDEHRGAGDSAADLSVPQRRLVTFLFCDVQASTALSTRLDPEDLRDLMISYQAVADAAIVANGGHVNSWVGDGVVACFGYPDSHENDALRAVLAGLEVIAGVARLQPAADGTRLAVRIGIHSGAAVVGGVSAAHGRETLAFGSTPNLAARTEAAAEVNTVFVSDSTARLVADRVELEDRGLHELKGADGPVRLHRVVSVRADASRFDVVRRRGLLPLVGRTAECDELATAWERALGGSGRTVLVVGEPGIGKSRLAEHVVDDLTPQARRVRLDGSDIHRSTPFRPIGRALATLWRGDVDEATRHVAAVAGPEAAGTVAPAVLALAGFAGDPSGGDASVSPQRQRAFVIDALMRVLLGEPSDPTLIVVEDAQWLDPSTLEVIDRLIDAAPTRALLVLITARPEESHIASRTDVERLDLAPLAQSETRTLVARLLTDAPDEVIDRCVQIAEGVPLFAEELVASIPEGDSASAVPETLQTTLQASLDRLPNSSRQFVQIAAVLGRRFEVAYVAEVAGVDEAEAANRLSPAIDSRLINPVDEHAGATFEFRHALIRDTAAASLLRRQAQPYHLTIAGILDREGAPVEEIARHLEAGDDIERAIERWQLAGITALQASANIEAIEHFGHAIDLLGRVPEGFDRDRTELMLQILHAVPLTLTQGWASEAVGAAYRRADELCATLVETPELFPTLSGLLTFDLVRAEHESAHRRATANLALARSSGSVELRIVAEQDLGASSFYLGDFAGCVEHCQAAHSGYDAGRHHAGFLMGFARDPITVALVHESMAHVTCGRLDTGLDVARAAVRQSVDNPHLFSQLWAKIAVCLVHLLRREHDELRVIADEVIEMSIAQGFPNWMAQAMVYRGWAGAQAGEPDARAQLEEGLAIWQMTGTGLAVPLFLSLHGELLTLDGRIDDAMAVLDHAIDVSNRTKEIWSLPNVLRVRGVAAVAAGDSEGALDLYRRSLQEADRLGARTAALAAALAIAAERPDDRAAVDEVRRRLAVVEGGSGTPPIEAARALVSASPG